MKALLGFSRRSGRISACDRFCSNVREVISGGKAALDLANPLLRPFDGTFDHVTCDDIVVWNGPTEADGDIVSLRLKDLLYCLRSVLRIGKPSPAARLRIYWNRPSSKTRVFLANPYDDGSVLRIQFHLKAAPPCPSSTRVPSLTGLYYR
ncbi:MAG: hypothetical protein AAGA22_08415 [Pseudomonadota bacterium]